MTVLRLAFFLLAAACTPLCAADPLPESLVLVARPELVDPFYGRTVLVVSAFGADQHVGFIVNRPSSLTLGRLFPSDGPSQKVADPVYIGGPADVQRIFALVARAASPGPGSIELMPGLYAAFDARTIDRVIAGDPGHARFVAGTVVWRPGELRQEIERGAWFVLDPDPALALRDPQGLWQELVARSQRASHLLRTGLGR